jgi:hypothetical protein
VRQNASPQVKASGYDIENEKLQSSLSVLKLDVIVSNLMSFRCHIAPVTSRLREAGALHSGVTAEDIAMLIRMTSAADGHQSRAMAIQVLLAGLTEPAKTDHRTPAHTNTSPRRAAPAPAANPAKRT